MSNARKLDAAGIKALMEANGYEVPAQIIIQNAAEAVHYYATNAFGWATGLTLEEALVKLGRSTGSDLIKRQKGGRLYTWTCRVMAPADAAYRISNYVPVGMELEDVRTFDMVSPKGFVLPVPDRDHE